MCSNVCDGFPNPSLNAWPEEPGGEGSRRGGARPLAERALVRIPVPPDYKLTRSTCFSPHSTMSRPSPSTPLLPRAAGLFPGPSLLWRTGALLGNF